MLFCRFAHHQLLGLQLSNKCAHGLLHLSGLFLVGQAPVEGWRAADLVQRTDVDSVLWACVEEVDETNDAFVRLWGGKFVRHETWLRVMKQTDWFKSLSIISSASFLHSG